MGRFDVVLMDLHMPILDGAGAVRTLREKGYAGPIVALSANAMQDERFNLRGVGFDGFVTKPVDKDELARLVASFDGARPLPLH